jgi:hypothetical protein
MYLRLNDLGVHCIVALQSQARKDMSCKSNNSFLQLPKWLGPVIWANLGIWAYAEPPGVLR